MTDPVRYATRHEPPRAADLVHPQKVRTNLRGSRLGAALDEIGRAYGRYDPDLAALVERAKLGMPTTDGADTFTAVRDALLAHADPAHHARVFGREHQQRALDLATSFNWHRVRHALHVEDAVAEYLDSIAKDHIKGRHYRGALKHFGIDPSRLHESHPDKFPPPTPETARRHAAFWTGLRDYVRTATAGLDVPRGMKTDEHLRNALVRLAEAEGHREELARRGGSRLKDAVGEEPPADPDEAAYRKGLGWRAKNPAADWTDHLTMLPGTGPAWRRTRGGNLVVNPGLSAEQYARAYAAAAKETP